MASNFIEKTLGPWSSHPANLRKQRFRLLILGFLPLLIVAVICVLVYNKLFNWQQIGMLICSVFFIIGFLFTICVLYLASFTIGSKEGRIINKDEPIFPLWLVIVFCVFWLLPSGLSALPDIPLLKKLEADYPNWAFLKFNFKDELKAILNMMAVAPFLCILTWILCAKEEKELKPNEKLVRRPWVLSIALICIGLLAASFFFPAYRLRMWIVLLPLTLISLSLWWFWRKRITLDQEETEQQEKKNEAEETKAGLPEQAAYITQNLPEGITYADDGKEQQITDCSKYIAENDASSIPLIALMDGKIPTEDQKAFLDRFNTLYENTLVKFIEDAKSNSEQILPDIILQGVDGSGRTEALCAAAVYAVAARGQKVLYIVQESSYATQLATKMKKRLHDLLIDCYYTVDYLTPNAVAGWVPFPASTPTASRGKQEQTKVNKQPELPPNILFATPEQVERSFFSNKNLIIPAANRAAIRNILLNYAVIMVDDFLEMPISVRAHLAFVLDKLRLLQTSEFEIGQFVIATTPLNQYGIENLAKRLFGLSRFKQTENLVTLRPRPCEPFWCGTLRIDSDKFPEKDREQDLEKAAKILLDICTRRKYHTLLYSKEFGLEEAKNLEKTYQEKGGVVSVSSHLYQLNVEKMPFDTIYYLSLTGRNAAAALRLSLPDNKAGTPVFFRIARKDEGETGCMEQFALFPDETAISLRAWHLRSVLPFLPRLTPIPSQVWSHFGVSLSLCRNAKIDQKTGGIRFCYDYYTEASRYGEDVIWPYLVLDSDPGIPNAAQEINFNILPNIKDFICRDADQSTGLRGDVLCLVTEPPQKTDSGTASQLAVWRENGDNILDGTMDLAHADQLTLVTADNQFSVDKIMDFNEKVEKTAASRYAMIITAQPRHGLSAYDTPVRRFSWNLPKGCFQVQNFENFQGERASFSLVFKNNADNADSNDFNSFTNPVSAEISGRMNPGGRICTHAVHKYGYEAYMSALVFLPETTCNEERIRQFLARDWSTEKGKGFSSPLTHAFSIALRNRIAGVSFFALTPVFLIKGIGRILFWILEPYNSGKTAFPMLCRLMEDQNLEFKRDLLKDIQTILKPNGQMVSLKELRIQSQMAFSGEDEISPDDWKDEIQRGLRAIDLLLDSEAFKDDLERRKKRQQEFIDPTSRSEEDRKLYEEFASVVKPALMDFQDVIDVSHFCVDYGWSPEKVDDVFDDFLWNSPDIFFVAKSYRSRYIEEGNKITSFVITNLRYGIRKEQYQDAKDQLDAATAKAMELLKGVTDPVKKALILHDHIVRICEYDKKACDDKDPSPAARTAYSVLVRHLAVCEGYVMAYRYLLNRAGIRSEEVLSDSMNHCWSYLYLNDNWYHADVTWDDPVYHGGKPVNAKISHEYFLLSDEKIATLEHCDWDVRGLPAASDTQFDNQNWDAY